MAVALVALRSLMPVLMILPCSDSYYPLQFVLLLPPHLLVAAYLLLAAKPLEVEQQLLQPWRSRVQFLPCHIHLATVCLGTELCILACEQL